MISMERGERMRNMKWYYLAGLVVGLFALAAVMFWIFRTTNLLGRLANSSSEQIDEPREAA